MKRAVAAGLGALALAGVVLSAQAQKWPSERPPRALAAHDVKFPPYEFRTLPNGLEVVAVPHHEEPAVSLRLIVRAGAAQDTDGRPGVAALAAALLDQGTTTKTAERIANTIDSIGGLLSTGAGTDLSYINCVVMKDGLSVGLELVSDLVEHPVFAPEEIDRQRQQTLSGLKVSYDDPEYVADRVFDRLVYGSHPYGRPQNGTPETVAAITRDDLAAFHKKWYGANNAILAIVGDVTPEEAFAGATRALGSWGPAQVQAPKLADPPQPARRVVVIDKPGAVQTEIRVGNIAIARKNPDYTALDLAIKVLGGEGANRLHRVLRSERGLTYGASADLTGLKQAGDIQATTNTRSATTGETLRLMVDEFWKMTRDSVGERELGGAQEYLTGSFPLTIETPSQIALQILNAVFFGLDLKELQTFRDRVNAVTPDDVQRVSRMYLHPDRLSIVLVGDAASFVDQLPAAGFDKYDRISVADLDLAAPDLRRKPPTASGGAIRPASYQSAVSDDPKRVIDKAIAAKGGLTKLKSIRTIRAEYNTTIYQNGQKVIVPGVASIAYPDRFRVDTNAPGGKLVQVYAGGQYWIDDGSGVRDAPPELRENIRLSLQRDIITLLLRCASGDVVLRGVDADPPLGGVMVSGKDLASVTLFINQDNGLIEKVRYDTPNSDGQTEEEFSDYRTVEGVRVPFHTVVRQPRFPIIERDVVHIHFNVALSPGLFVKPS